MSPRTSPLHGVFTIFILIAAGLLSACGNYPRENKGDGSAGSGPRDGIPRESDRDIQWYRVEDGTVKKVLREGASPERFEVSEEKQFLPWTVQERIAGFTEIDGKLYCAVNGAGVAVFELDGRENSDEGDGSESPGSGETAAEHHLTHVRSVNNKVLFAGRTIGTVFAYNHAVYCHLYRNRLFDTPPPETEPVALTALLPGEDRFRVTVLSCRENYPGWEAVELLPSSNQLWRIAWKYSEKEKTEFRYSRFDINSREEHEITRKEFRDFYNFEKADSLPLPVKQAAEHYFGDVNKPRYEGKPVVVHLSVNFPGSTAPERYRLGNITSLGEEARKLVRVSGFRRGGCYVFLAPYGELLRVCDKKSGIKLIELPPLPDDFVYTHIWAGEKAAAVCWEEQRFTEVGRAGMVVLLPD